MGFFGGGLEGNETPEQAAVREIKEELDYDLKDFIFFKKYEIEKATIPMTAYVFLAEIGFVDEFGQGEEHGMEFFDIGDALKLKIVPGDKMILRDLKTFL